MSSNLYIHYRWKSTNQDFSNLTAQCNHLGTLKPVPQSHPRDSALISVGCSQGIGILENSQRDSNVLVNLKTMEVALDVSL